jgi:sulfur carrier protein ThiS
MSETPKTNVRLVVANTGLNAERQFEPGTTVRQALESLNLGSDAVQVKVNRKAVNLDDPLQANDRISVAPRNMKAA